MKIYILKIYLFALIAVLQITLVPLFVAYGVWPNLVLILIVILSLSARNKDAFLATIICGVILDLTGIMPAGLNILFLVGIIYLLEIVSKRAFPETNPLVIFIATFCTSILFYLYNHLFLKYPPQILPLFIEALYNAISAEIIYFFFSRKNRQDTIKIGVK